MEGFVLRKGQRLKTFAPARYRGDGPLPFLFGMKAEKAKIRYQLSLKKNDEDVIWLEVLPRLEKDSANWVKAVVIIEGERITQVISMLAKTQPRSSRNG